MLPSKVPLAQYVHNALPLPASSTHPVVVIHESVSLLSAAMSPRYAQDHAIESLKYQRVPEHFSMQGYLHIVGFIEYSFQNFFPSSFTLIW